MSIIDLQGQLNRTYVVGFFFSNQANRMNLRQRWPADDENNLERLADAGMPYDRQVMKCRNCGGKEYSQQTFSQAAYWFSYQKWAMALVAASRSASNLSGLRSSAETVTPSGTVCGTARSLARTSSRAGTAGMSHLI